MNTPTNHQSFDESPLLPDQGCDLHEHLARKYTIADLWSAADVQSNCDGLTEEQAWEVLKEVQRRYDPSHGINWTVIEDVAASLFPQPDISEDDLDYTQDSHS